MDVQVWLDDQPAATLERPLLAPSTLSPLPTPPAAASAQGPLLRYLPEWLDNLRAYPLSPTLALAGPGEGAVPIEHWHRAIDRFVHPLLPQGEARRGLAMALEVDVEEHLALASAAGEDLPGAVAFRGVSGQRGGQGGGQGAAPWPLQRVIGPGELQERLQAPATDWLVGRTGAEVMPWWPAATGLGGGESRPLLGVYLDQGQWWWTRTPQLASTHLLEPHAAQGPWAELPFNRLFCLRLAARLGLEVVPAELRRLPAPMLELQRMDRLRLPDGRVRRLHGVSAAQMLETGDRAEAPWAQLAGWLAHSPQPLVDRRALIRWWIFQGLTGHQAAGPDELWFRLDHTGLRVAPAMHLWCPPAHHAAGGDQGQGQDEGRAVPGRMVPPARTARDWALTAKACGVKPRSLANELRRLCEAAAVEAQALAVALEAEVPLNVSHAITEVVAANSQRQLALVDDLLHTDHRDL